MKNKVLLSALFAAATFGFTACNDDFLERYPVTDLTEENAFQEYDNFKSYLYPCYEMFRNSNIYTSTIGTGAYYTSGQRNGDYYAGVVTDRGKAQNPYAYQAISASSTNSAWDFSYIRRIAIALRHIDEGEKAGVLNADQAKHLRSVAKFFHAYWYMELVNRFGDVPYVEEEITDLSDGGPAYAPRTPRAEVVTKIIENMEYAIANIGNPDGQNGLTADACRAALSRFLLREGTWAKYHKLNEPYQEYLTKCLSVSEELMAKYPTLYYGCGTEKEDAAGYGELFTTEKLGGVPGVIYYAEYADGILMHRGNDYEHIAANAADFPQHTIDLFLMKNGKPIYNAASGYQGGKGKDMWDTFAERDPRLYQNVQPPYAVLAPAGGDAVDGVNVFKTWKFIKEGDKVGNHVATAEDAAKYRYYIDYMGLNNNCVRGGMSFNAELGHKRCPGQNWGAALSPTSPNLADASQTAYMQCRTGYYYWKNYDMWEYATGSSNYCVADKPIFRIEEVLLNYAEASFELGKFDQSVADRTINLLRDRASVARMNVGEIGADFDPNRDRGASGPSHKWWSGKMEDYEVAPVLWEIRRERMIELFGEGHSWYDVRRWAKAPYFVNRQACGMWIKSADNLYNIKNNTYGGSFVDYEAIMKGEQAAAQDNSVGSGWIYTLPSPMAYGGWLDAYYLNMVPTNQIVLNPALTQNPGYEELFGAVGAE